MSETLKDGVVLLHPIRYKIIETLKVAEKPMYIDEIAKKIKENRRLTSFHLSTLENKGYATSEFGVIKKPASMGKAGRFYRLTSKVDIVLEELTKILEKS